MKKRVVLIGACFLLGACQTINTVQESSRKENQTTTQTTQVKLSVKELREKVLDASQTIKSAKNDMRLVVRSGIQKQEMISLTEYTKEPVSVKVSVKGLGLDTESYYVDNQYYVTVNGVWQKASIDIEQLLNAVDEPIKAFEQLDLQYMTVEETDAEYVLNFNITDKAGIDAYVEMRSKSDSTDMLSHFIEAGSTIDGIKGSYKIDKKTFYMVDTLMTIDMTVKDNSQKQKMSVEVSGKNSNINSTQPITLPQEVLNAN